MSTSEAVIDLGAIRANTALIRAATDAQVMAVVKAAGYGHGMVPAATAALSGGATWLGVALLDEALELRRAGIAAPILVWLWAPGETEQLAAAVEADVDVSVSSTQHLNAVRAVATKLGRPARVHLKVDTGLARNGARMDDWPVLVEAAAWAESTRDITVVGVWSHLACADEPGHPANEAQLEAFTRAVEVARSSGVVAQLRHLANSAATLTWPQAHFDLVRVGIALYGLNPVPSVPAPELRPAMTLRTQTALVKNVGDGQGVSYGHAYTTSRPSTLALVPLGYADGIPRAASNIGPVSVAGRRSVISGRVSMDQFVVDLGPSAGDAATVHAGDEVVVFGSGRHGEPTAQDWATATGTIHYEIVTRIGARVPRRYVDDGPHA